MKKSSLFLLLWMFLPNNASILNLQKFISLLTICFLLSAAGDAFATIRYVKADASGNGSTWNSASGDLQAIINASAAGDQVWVANGTYKPTTGTDQNATFSIPNGLKMYGGFAGTESNLADRSLSEFNKSILSGDIGITGDASDNSNHLVTFNNANNETQLDGFVITRGGNGNVLGGGIYNGGNSNPVIANCHITQNSASNGGGVFSNGNAGGKSASPTFINCSFTQNKAQENGGAIFLGYADNVATTTFINCSFSHNEAEEGGAIYNQEFLSTNQIHLNNCIVWNNPGGGLISIYDLNRNYKVYNSDVDNGNYTGGNNINQDPLFVDADNGDLHLQPCSPAINSGNNDYNSTDKDLSGSPRIAGNTIDMGAYEFQGQSGPASIVNMPQPVTVCLGQEAKFSVAAIGGNLSFQWQKNEVNISGATDNVYSIAATALADTGKYRVIVSGCGSTVTSDPARLTVNVATAPIVTVANNCGSSTLSTTATGTLLWSTGETTPSITVSNPGTYTVTQTVNGCTSAAGSAVAAPKTSLSKPVITANGPTTFCNSGSVTLSSPAGFSSYKWSNNATTQTINVTQSGSYSVVVSNASGCSSPSSDAITVTVGNDIQKPVITCPAAVTFCYAASESYTISSLQATDNCGIASISYAITGATTRSGNGANASGIFKPGTSTITWTVKDGSGNTSTCQSSVVINEKFTVAIPDGWALGSGCTLNTVYKGYVPAEYILLVAKPTGGKSPYTYKWSNGATASFILVNPAAATTYSVTIKDAKGCTQSASKQINVVDVRCGSKMDKVTLCYKGATKCTEQKDVAGYLLKGAYLGSCKGKTASKAINEIVEKEVTEQSDLAMQAFPNPSTTYFKLAISSNNEKDKISVTIVDQVGRSVERRIVNPGQTLQIGDQYQPGMYFAQAVQGNKRVTVKLVKQAW